MANGSRETKASADAMQRNHPSADDRAYHAIAKPKNSSRNDEQCPKNSLQQDVHLLAAVIEALRRNALRLFADKLGRELLIEHDIIAAKTYDFLDQTTDPIMSRNQSDNRIQDENDRKHTMCVLKRCRTKGIIEETERIRIERQSRKQQHKKGNRIDPVEINEAHFMAFDVFLIDNHLIFPLSRDLLIS